MIIKSIAEYYVYNDRGTTTQTFTANVNMGSYCTRFCY
jgi:hypothetical protein